ncbi:hypothetical protein V5O48_018257, partial [Marasmius crinis-equi]
MPEPSSCKQDTRDKGVPLVTQTGDHVLSSSSARSSPRLPPKGRLARLLSAKDVEISAALAQAKQLKDKLQRTREVYEEEYTRGLAEHGAEVEDMERRHFFGIGRKEYEGERLRETVLKMLRDSHAMHLVKLQQDIEMYRQSTSEVQGQFQRVMEHQLSRKHFDDAIEQLEALFRDQQVGLINEIRTRLQEQDPNSNRVNFVAP